MLLTEWETRRDVQLAPSTVSLLRARYAKQLDVLPSGEQAGAYDLLSRGFIGAISLGDTDLIIAPKVPLDTAVYMIAEVERLPEFGEAFAPFAEASLTSLVARWFATTVGPLLERSMVRRYCLHEDETVFVRGRVDVVATTRRALVGRSEITCAFDDHTPDVVENQILLAATHVLLGSPRLATTVAARLRRISAMLAEVQRRLPPRWKRRGIVFDRLNRRYRPALRLAEWVLARSSPELAQAIAAPNFHEFLIDMSGIFERFVVDQLSSRLRHSGFGCYAQLSRWLDVNWRLFRTAPDLVTIGPDGRLLVLDTKYKRLGGTFRPSESDVYQVITDCVTRGSNRGVLVYPRLESNAGFSATILNAGVTLTFAPVELGSGRAALHRSLDELAIALVGEP